MKPKRWSKQEEAMLERLSSLGWTVAQIAAEMGRSESSVKRKRYYKKPPAAEGPTSTRLTDFQKQWLADNYADLKNPDIMRALRISHNTLHRYAREMGLKKSEELIRKTQLDAAKAAKESHLRNGTYPPKGYIIPFSREAGFKKGVTSEMRLGKERNAERIAKARESRNKRIKADRARIMFGLEQKTKMRLVRQSRKKLQIRYNLRKSGYAEDPADHNVYYFPADGKRSKIRERNGRALGLKFLPQQ